MSSADCCYTDRNTGEKVTHESEVPFYKRQKRLIIGNNGLIDPTSIDDYLAIGGYAALAKALKMTPEQIIDEVKKSGLRGRGGAGFPTGSKWETTRKAHGEPKYVICNADEGDPGAFMDRSLVEGNPHSVLEGMIIGAYAIGSHQGYIYIRNEYPLAVRNMRHRYRAGRGLRAAGREYPGLGFQFQCQDKPGRRRLCLRRVHGPDGLPGGQGRGAAGQICSHLGAGPVGKAHRP